MFAPVLGKHSAWHLLNIVYFPNSFQKENTLWLLITVTWRKNFLTYCYKPGGDKYVVAQKWGNIHIVNPRWVDQSIARRGTDIPRIFCCYYRLFVTFSCTSYKSRKVNLTSWMYFLFEIKLVKMKIATLSVRVHLLLVLQRVPLRSNTSQRSVVQVQAFNLFQQHQLMIQ